MGMLALGGIFLHVALGNFCDIARTEKYDCVSIRKKSFQSMAFFSKLYIAVNLLFGSLEGEEIHPAPSCLWV